METRANVVSVCKRMRATVLITPEKYKPPAVVWYMRIAVRAPTVCVDMKIERAITLWKTFNLINERTNTEMNVYWQMSASHQSNGIL